MTGPFDEYANAILFVPVEGNQTVVDEWGNVRPVSQTETVRAWIKESRNQPKQQLQPGQSISKTYVTGYLTNPMRWPQGIRPAEVEIEVDGRRGKLQILSQLPRSFNSESETGDRIEGWLQFQV